MLVCHTGRMRAVASTGILHNMNAAVHRGLMAQHYLYKSSPQPGDPREPTEC